MRHIPTSPTAKLWFVCLLWVVLVPAPLSFGQEVTIQRGSRLFALRLSGKLTDSRGEPIAAATIGLARWDANDPVGYRNGQEDLSLQNARYVWRPLTRTSPNGTYQFLVKLQPGQYRVIAAFASFEVATSVLDTRQASQRLNRDRGAPFVATVDLVAYRAKSDAVPDSTPRQSAFLPAGSFPPPPGPPAPAPPGPPGPPVPGNQEFINVYYATNREAVSGRPGEYLDRAAASTAMSYGACAVSIPPTHQIGQIERPQIWQIRKVEDVRQHIVIIRKTVVANEQAFQGALRYALNQSGSEAFLFVHGYNVEFDDAVRRTAQLFRDLQFDGVPILFSWPAQDAWWRYPAAEDAVNISARHLEHFLTSTLADTRFTAINVIAHSLGNRVLMTALERIALRNANNNRFKNIVLAAPDINVADFNEVSQVLQSAATKTTIYSSSHDVALQVSRAFHSYARLGEAPPINVTAQIDTVDASAIQRDVLGHSYFGDSATLLRDLFLLLKQGLDPAKRFLERRSLNGFPYWLVPGG